MFLQNIIVVGKCIKYLILGIFFSFSYKLSGNLMAKNHTLRRKLLVYTLRFPESITIFYRSGGGVPEQNAYVILEPIRTS